MEPAAPRIKVTSTSGVATIWLDRAEKRNAMTYDMWRQLGEEAHRLSVDPAVRVVVLRSTSDHFCAGADIHDLHAPREDLAESFMAVNLAAEARLATCAKPTIAMISGDCIGGGCALAIDCDLRIADRSARFGITPARLGLAYPPASVERLTRLVGPGVAAQMVFTGDLYDVDWALRVGLVNEVVDDGEALLQRVVELAITLSQRSLLTQQAAKQMIAEVVVDGSVSAALSRHWQRVMAASGDPDEGRKAFVERRAPVFGFSGDDA
jgi:enoyl-CoA hydratase/carnithine racemase